jgi:hypothetical protein
MLTPEILKNSWQQELQQELKDMTKQGIEREQFQKAFAKR